MNLRMVWSHGIFIAAKSSWRNHSFTILVGSCPWRRCHVILVTSLKALFYQLTHLKNKTCSASSSFNVTADRRAKPWQTRICSVAPFPLTSIDFHLAWPSCQAATFQQNPQPLPTMPHKNLSKHPQMVNRSIESIDIQLISSSQITSCFPRNLAIRPIRPIRPPRVYEASPRSSVETGEIGRNKEPQQQTHETRNGDPTAWSWWSWWSWWDNLYTEKTLLCLAPKICFFLYIFRKTKSGGLFTKEKDPKSDIYLFQFDSTCGPTYCNKY